MEELIKALVAAQSEMGHAIKSASNSHFKSRYATLDDIIEAAIPTLTKHGLAVSQYPESFEGNTYCVTRLLHTSGNEISTRVLLHIKDPSNMQDFGKAMTYTRRYTFASICCITSGEDDNDGEVEQKPEMAKSEYISQAQANFLRSLMKGNKELEAAVCKAGACERLEELHWKKKQSAQAYIETKMAQQ
jgi:hypothetical protein